LDHTVNTVNTRQCRKIIPFAGILLSALCLLLFLLWSGSEPRYQGQALSYWLAALDNPSTATNVQTITALKSMGAKAAVRLVPMLEASDSPFKLRVVELARKQALIQVHFTPASVKQQRAERAFECMGEQASAAAPGLASLLIRRGSEPPQYLGDPASRAANALGCLGYRAIPYLRPALRSEHARVRYSGVSVLALCSLDTAPETMTELLKLLDDADPKVRTAGAYALGKVHRHSGLVIPRLARMLADVNPSARKQAALAIGHFGSQASNALATLRQMCSDVAPEVRSAAAAALTEVGGAPGREESSVPGLRGDP